ncbi:MAG: HAD-IA family hydrolase [Candidatus Lokiarchaeota archaeon]|nr:HAD-IA family hydrolase [Candidatus Lokiarchaeota archaeon]
MITHVIFDLDGVLVDAREIHFEALNLALEKICGEQYKISKKDHLSKYDGLPTKKKLEILGIDYSLHEKIWKEKQKKTLEVIDYMMPNVYMRNILRTLKSRNYSIHVCSNSIKKTIKMMLIRNDLIEFIDEIFSNEDVKFSKPSPEIYLQSMIKAGASPKETLIIEDSPIGRKAAIDSGAHLHAVRNTDDVYLQQILRHIDKIERKEQVNKDKWHGGKMNVLIPMAGAGSRFEKAGYTFPKPLIEVNGKPMIELVVENLNVQAKYVFIVQKSHSEKYNLKNMLSSICPKCEVVEVDGVTEGAACTTLLAKQFIDNDEPLLMANSDQYVDWDSHDFMYSMQGDNEIDAGILTFKSHHPKWSFVKLGEDGYVNEVAEKDPISDIATVGIYYWKKGSDYVKYAEDMISKDIRFNNEFYVCPVFNQAIEDNKKIKISNIASNSMWGLGTPEDLKIFMDSHK